VFVLILPSDWFRTCSNVLVVLLVLLVVLSWLVDRLKPGASWPAAMPPS
jgi:hypothetical protein